MGDFWKYVIEIQIGQEQRIFKQKYKLLFWIRHPNKKVPDLDVPTPLLDRSYDEVGQLKICAYRAGWLNLLSQVGQTPAKHPSLA
jgi:hypothetical protein